TATAESKYKEAMAQAEQLGEANPKLARSVSNMANFYYAQGDGQQADQLYRRAIALREKAKDMESADLARDLIGLANIQSKAGNKAEALEDYTRAKELLTKANQPV